MPIFRQRRGTAAALAAANETPAAGQIYFELDTNRIKVGNGTTAYNSLPYLDNDISIADVQGLSAALQAKADSSDPRFTDQRVPLDGSVTLPKLSPTLTLDGGNF